MLVLIQVIHHVQENDIFHIDFLVPDYYQFDVDEVKFLLLGIVIVIEISNPTELHQVQNTLKVITKEKHLDLPTVFLAEKFVIVFFLNPTLEIDNNLEIYFFISASIKTTLRTASASRSFVDFLKPNSSRNHDKYTEFLSESEDKFDVKIYIYVPLKWQKLYDLNAGFVTCEFFIITQMVRKYLQDWKSFIYRIAVHQFRYLF